MCLNCLWHFTSLAGNSGERLLWFGFSCPNCTLCMANNHMLTVLEWWILYSFRIHMKPLFPYCNHMIDYIVQYAIGIGNPETTVAVDCDCHCLRGSAAWECPDSILCNTVHIWLESEILFQLLYPWTTIETRFLVQELQHGTSRGTLPPFECCHTYHSSSGYVIGACSVQRCTTVG